MATGVSSTSITPCRRQTRVKKTLSWRLGRRCFERRSDLSCARQCPSDVGIFRTELEGDQPVAMLAVDLKTGPDLLRAPRNTWEHFVHLILTLSSTMKSIQ